jgi:hypothetical protein
MAVNYRGPGFYAFGVRKLAASIVPKYVPGGMQEVLDGLGAESMSNIPTPRQSPWPSYYQLESRDHLMLTHVLHSYDLSEPTVLPYWWWHDVYVSTLVSNPAFPGQRIWRATLKHETL